MERFHERHGKREHWLTFGPTEHPGPFAKGFCGLEGLAEYRLPPGAAVPHQPLRDGEMVTFVREGALTYEDSGGRSGVIHAGEFQRVTASGDLRRSEANASRGDWAHVFRLLLRPSEPDIRTNYEQKRFSAAERRGKLCVVASPDGRRGSLHIHRDALVYSALLAPGQHMVAELGRGRSAWLHVALGMVTLGEIILGVGDGASFTAERSVSMTAREETEILMLDLHAERKASG